MSKKPISTGTEWDFKLLEQYDCAIAQIADSYHLDTYPNQIEVISADQMLDAYASVGMPIMYNHWSYGKQFLSMQSQYQQGQVGLAYEIVINSNPCIAYLMEENTIATQAIVIAHACYGHNSFFKNNYLFKSWTCADSIIDYLSFAKGYIASCEEKYGIDAVETILDAAHSIMNYGVHRYHKPPPLSTREEIDEHESRQERTTKGVNKLWEEVSNRQRNITIPDEPEENLLYFIEKHAPLLEPWQREVVRIVRKVAQYFFPQRQTRVMNEGWACFWHYLIIHQLHSEGKVDEAFMMEFLQAHTSVIKQLPFDSPHYQGINPYTLGFHMMMDIKRICDNPTDEDREWFPELAGQDWLEAINFAMRNFKDESFINQYLSPPLIRELKLFTIQDDDQNRDLLVTAIHNEKGYKPIRQQLAAQFDIAIQEPRIEIRQAKLLDDRTLLLKHHVNQRRPLNELTHAVVHHIHRLWGFPVVIESVDMAGKVIATYRSTD